MGTTGTPQTIQQVCADLLKWSNYEKMDGDVRMSCKSLDSAKVSGGFWILLEVEDKGKKYITATFHKISTGKNMTYYKSIDIDAHPCYYNCPKSWLNQIQPQTSYGEEWLETAKSVSQVKITRGLEFNYKDTDYRVDSYHGGGYWVIKDLAGARFKMASNMIMDSILNKDSK